MSRHFTEALTILIAAILLLTGVFLHLGLIPYPSTFFGNDSRSSNSPPVGTIFRIDGPALRLTANDVQFRELREGMPVFLDDTILTTSSGQLDIELKDGQKIHLDPSTLVKLSFQADFESSGAVQRAFTQDKVHIAASKAKPTRPAIAATVPAASVLELRPLNSSKLSWQKQEYIDGTKSVTLLVRFDRIPERYSLHLSGKNELGSWIIPPGFNEFQVKTVLSPAQLSPGQYRLSVRNRDGALIRQNLFSVPADLELIEPGSTEGISSRISGLSSRKMFEGFKLKWSPIEGEGPYRVTVRDQQSGRTLLNAAARSNKLLLNPNKLVLRPMEYTVERKLEYGFRAYSPKSQFGFEYASPNLTAPSDKAVLANKSQEPVILTWSKTNYTEAYDLEIGQDSTFKSVVMSRRLSDNFFSWVSPPDGKYLWRVRSVRSQTVSQFSSARSFTVRTDSKP
jgi:hypothetical protein